jgi:hypothetical protein
VQGQQESNNNNKNIEEFISKAKKKREIFTSKHNKRFQIGIKT